MTWCCACLEFFFQLERLDVERMSVRKAAARHSKAHFKSLSLARDVKSRHASKSALLSLSLSLLFSTPTHSTAYTAQHAGSYRQKGKDGHVVQRKEDLEQGHEGSGQGELSLPLYLSPLRESLTPFCMQTLTQKQVDEIPKMEPQAKMDALNALLRKKLLTASQIDKMMHYTAVEKQEASM